MAAKQGAPAKGGFTVSAKAARTPDAYRRRSQAATVVEAAKRQDLDLPMTLDEIAERANAVYSRAFEDLVYVGRLLRKVAEEGAEWAALLPKLRFEPKVATQLRRVAEAIDERRLELDAMPRDLTRAYELATLAPPELEQARGVGLLSPDVTAEAIRDFKRRVRDARPGRRGRGRPGLSEAAALRRERDRLVARLREIDARLRALGEGPADIELGPADYSAAS